MDEVGHLGSAAFFLLFLFAGLSKVDSWQAWRSAVAEFVPNARVSRLAAASVPGLEFTCAALLVAQQALGLLATARDASRLCLRRNRSPAESCRRSMQVHGGNREHSNRRGPCRPEPRACCRGRSVVGLGLKQADVGAGDRVRLRCRGVWAR